MSPAGPPDPPTGPASAGPAFGPAAGPPVGPPFGPSAGPPFGPAAGMPPPPADPGNGRRRLDGRTVLSRVLTLGALRKQWGLVVGLVAVLGLNGGFRVTGLVVALLVVLAATAGAAVVEWVRTSYGVLDGRLVVERGLLRRSLTVVPIDRIRGVDVHASALQRLLGIVSVRVDAAATGGRDDEAVLDSVSEPDARELRDVLLRQASSARATAERAGPDPAGPDPAGLDAAGLDAAGPDAVGTDPGTDPAGSGGARPGTGGPGGRGRSDAGAAAPGEVLARFRPRWLLYAPLVGGYLLAPLAAVGALAQFADDVRLPLSLQRRVEDAVGSGPTVPLVAAVAVAVLLLAVLGAVVTAAVANWGFTLSRRGGTLVAERGLLSRRQVTLEHDRVRGYALAEPLTLRAVGAARLTALVTGLGGGGDEGGTGRRGQLLPLGPASVAREVAARAVVQFDAPLRAHPPAARRRRLVRATVPWLVPAVGFAVAGIWPAAAAALVLLALGVPLGLDRYAGLGTALDPRSVAVRSGSLRRRTVVLARRGVVGWTVQESFFQRRAGLVTVTVAVGAGDGGYDAVDIGAPDAVALMREVDPRRVGPLTTLGG